MTRSIAVLVGMFAGVLLSPAAARAATSCENLAGTTLPKSLITSAKIVPAGSYQPPPMPPREARMDNQPMAPFNYASLPAFCQVTATVQTSPTSTNQIEIWMPSETWNGKMLVHTFRYFGGLLEPPMLADPVARGYASVTTDLGSGRTQSAQYMYGKPELVTDWAHRGWHDATVAAKSAMALFYGRGPELSYIDSCGGATRPTMQEMQMYPEDYDGIATSFHTAFASRLAFGEARGLLFTEGPAGDLGPKVDFVYRSAMNKCDALDGLTDDIINDPEGCLKVFDPGSLQCREGDSPNCLTAPQVSRVRAWYDVVRNPRTNEVISGRRYPGSERGFNGGQRISGYSVDFYRYLVFNDPNWTFESRPLNFDADVAISDASPGGRGNAVNPDIEAFVKRGGKLLLFAGWYDNGYATMANIDYYKAVTERLGPLASNSVRLFMIPDQASCPDGRVDFTNAPRPDGKVRTIATTEALEAWRERNVTPEQLFVREVQDNKTSNRLLCPYPTVPFYRGSGDTGDPANFTCKAP